MPEVRIRPAEAEDEALLYAVYASTRAEELARTDWSEEQKQQFLQMQYHAQRVYYLEHYTDATYSVIEVGGVPAGRLYVARWPEDIRIMDIALLPEWRGQGVGTSLLRAILDEGRASGRKVSIHVEIFNPARRLYERLGFRQVSERGVYLLMEWRPADT